MFVDFFIKRPVFATVCALLILLIGAASVPALPLAQFPQLAPPQVQVLSTYVGASSEVVESAVTRPLEQQINGVAGMRYMQSNSASDGTSVITITFDVGYSQDIAAVDVQNRVNTALAGLPTEVKNTGVTIRKTTPALILAAGFYSEDGSLSPIFVSNYLDVYVVDALKRLRGVGDVRIFGERRYAMRVWLDPAKLAARGLTAGDVVAAIREQNAQIAPGQIGGPPAPPGQTFQMTVRARGRLTEAREFESIVLQTAPDGSLVQLRDVGSAELGAESYATNLRFGGRDAVGIGIFQLPDANALELELAAKRTLEEVARRFPPSLKYQLAFDPTAAVRESIREVLTTLGEAILIVILVIFVFLQDWRSTLIPAVTIPVSLIGTFAFVKAFGFSINTLTLFGIVLATGLVVDDAIVVVENISRNLGTRGRTDARVATHQAMREVTGAVIGTSLVLIAVFVPVAFFPGTTGRLYRQFSLTIAFSIAISTFNALTLSPALAALLMRPPREHRFSLLRWFNSGFDRLNRAYTAHGARAMRHKWWIGLAFAGMVLLTWLVFRSVPTGFVPDEDLGYFVTQVQAPPGASLGYTVGIMKQAEKSLLSREEVKGVFAVAGFSFIGSGANRGTIFTNLKPGAERKGAAHSVFAVVDDMRRKFAGITGAVVVPFLPPAIQGQGATGGFTFEVLDQAELGFPTLAGSTAELVGAATASGQVTGVFSGFTVDDPQLQIAIDRERAQSIGIPSTQLQDALGVYLGAQYVNDFDFNNRSYRVYAQALPSFRGQPSDVERLYVRSRTGALVPLQTVVHLSQATAPQVITHYNLFRSVELNGAGAAGVSSGQAIAAMENAARRTLPEGMGFEWSGISWEQVRAGGQASLLFALALLFSFLVLAALYESFSLPLVIILAVPVAILGALAAQKMRGLVNDVYCQIGLVMLIGLASKNAILIVEFAEQLRRQGKSDLDAVLEAAHLRLRPILMTSLAFILGVLPLVFASGPGANGRRSLGTAVAGGLIVATVLNLLFTPVLYLMMRAVLGRVLRRRRGPEPTRPEPATPGECARA